MPGPHDHSLLNPFGFMFDEISASSLVKVDLEGDIVEPSAHRIHRAGFIIHSAVHAARPEVGCVIHSHTRAGMAVSMMKCGLLPLSQHANLFYGRAKPAGPAGVAGLVAQTRPARPVISPLTGVSDALPRRTFQRRQVGAT